MALIELKDIGKIYVSDENVSVGIRGVNLKFDRGEFVAITGKSGSGKSTLLNVISGMDSYEEGELLINGEPTSHYIQEDWEEYRKNNISFIFQNYNIIDSFTVLENVELALMHIEDHKERRKRALELIDRVGLTSHIKHKGSKLSGGQKQRTVIARALAKDSPIILADEPTGNLDSKTSKEIIALLKEVSENKLLIIVTHDYDEVSDYATRHIRVFNGAIESDTLISEQEIVEDNSKEVKGKSKIIKNGLNLGFVLFKSKPKLSSFLSFLLFIGLVAIFLITSLFDVSTLFNKEYMFSKYEGRLVIVNRSGEPIKDEDLKDLVQRYNAEYYLHYDLLLDNNAEYNFSFTNENGRKTTYPNCFYSFDKDYGKSSIGNYPINNDEVLLYLPIKDQPIFGKNEILIDKISVFGCEYKVSGIKYFYDNNKEREVLFTKDGYRLVLASKYISQGNKGVYLSTVNDNVDINTQIGNFSSSFNVDENKIYIDKEKYLNGFDVNDTTNIKFSATYVVYDNFSDKKTTYEFDKNFNYEYLVTNEDNNVLNEYNLIFNAFITIDMVEEVLSKSYKQASLFFANDREAYAAIDSLENEGYVAIPSDTEYIMDESSSIVNLVIGLAMGIGWLLAIMFMAFFVNLCTHKSIASFKGDVAIMRSMGIQKEVIKVGMYIRMLICLIPGIIMTSLIAFTIYLTPQTNDLFIYLYAHQYLAIFIGMLLITVIATKKQIKKLFDESVKKSLLGGGN